MPELAGRRTLRPPAPAGADVEKVRLSPDGKRLAYVRADDTGSSVFLADPETGWSRRLAGYPVSIYDLAWSPDGEMVAYVVGAELPLPAEHSVAWARTSAPGEAGRAPGASFAWGPENASLFVADVKGRALVRVNPASGKQKKLCELPDDGIPGLPPVIAVAPEARRIAFTSKSARKDQTSVWILSRDGEAIATSWLTGIPGLKVYAHPFWSPGGQSLGLSIVHLAMGESMIVLVPQCQGDGDLYHQAERLDAPVAPAWSPSSRYLAFFAAGDDERQRLTLLDCKTRSAAGLLDPGEAAGTPRFVDPHHLVIDGGPAAHVLTFNDPL
jgi:dipeptidyl aminopeptidase/acylaminoacyl peptidase